MRTLEAENTSLNFPKLSPGQTIPLSEAQGPEAVEKQQGEPP